MNIRTCCNKFVFLLIQTQLREQSVPFIARKVDPSSRFTRQGNADRFFARKIQRWIVWMSMSENAETNIDTANSHSVSAIQSTQLQSTEKQKTTDWHIFIQWSSKKDRYFIRRTYNSFVYRTRSTVRYFLPFRFVTCTSKVEAAHGSFHLVIIRPRLFASKDYPYLSVLSHWSFLSEVDRFPLFIPFDLISIRLYTLLLIAVMGTFPCRQVSYGDVGGWLKKEYLFSQLSFVKLEETRADLMSVPFRSDF